MSIRPVASLVILFFGLVALAAPIGVRKAFSASASVIPFESSNLALSSPPSQEPEVYSGSFFYSTTAKMLEVQGVRVYPEDIISAFPDPQLGLGSTIKVYRAKPVVIRDGLQDILVRTWAKNVHLVLEEQRLEVGEKDLVAPSGETAIPPHQGAFAITITRVAETQFMLKESQAFAIQYRDDSNLERGKTQVEQAGEFGILEKIFLIRRENGIEVSRALISTQMTKKAISQIVRKGTKIIEYGIGLASWYGGVPFLTAAHRTLPFGTRVKVINLSNGRSVVVRIADRGPFVDGRVIDLSQDAFASIASLGSGVTQVRLEKE